MEILHAAARNPVRAVLFDFDGTISTLRCGWESVMKPLMLEMISGGCDPETHRRRFRTKLIARWTTISTSPPEFRPSIR